MGTRVMAKSTNRLFEIFAGEHVSLLTKMTMERSVNNGEMIETVKTPISVKGYLTEADDVYYYLGLTPGTISQAVKIDEVTHVEPVGEEDELMEQLLVDGEIPTEDKFN